MAEQRNGSEPAVHSEAPKIELKPVAPPIEGLKKKEKNMRMACAVSALNFGLVSPSITMVCAFGCFAPGLRVWGLGSCLCLGLGLGLGFWLLRSGMDLGWGQHFALIFIRRGNPPPTPDPLPASPPKVFAVGKTMR